MYNAPENFQGCHPIFEGTRFKWVLHSTICSSLKRSKGAPNPSLLWTLTVTTELSNGCRAGSTATKRSRLMSDESCEVTKKSGSRLNHGWCATQVDALSFCSRTKARCCGWGRCGAATRTMSSGTFPPRYCLFFFSLPRYNCLTCLVFYSSLPTKPPYELLPAVL